ncbi:hypothetical protein REC12_19330 [Desulfosporosinus sp. PR]|uniref:hypothetical protein n=1 Tax=Candidatus Desulfosporosinus nitrosoreducens TaxID=3401928 RepID=UPI0027EB8B0E|nr:hypothetical protein [Desulfosporosinus sp. PR]MDQ7095747.1 hypothetical protein [Desulfosporosinus sp. PR]
MKIKAPKGCAVVRNILGLFPFLLILAMFLWHLALPDKTFSPKERRYLAQWPVFRLENVLNGTYETKAEAYFADQFPWRDLWVQIQEVSEQILGPGPDQREPGFSREGH